MDGSANTAESGTSAPAPLASQRIWRRYLKDTPLQSLQPRRICIVKPSALGDIVQTLPVLSMLRQRFPQAHIAWVVKPGLAGILRGHPELDQVIEMPRGRGWRMVLGFFRLLNDLRRQRFDLVLDIQGLFRSGLMAWCTRAPRRLGYRLAREGAYLAYTDTIDVDYRTMPALEHYRLFAQRLGCSDPVPQATVPITHQDRQKIHALLARLPRPWLAIHAGAQWETKRWPPESFAEIARWAQQRHGAGIVLLGGPGEGALATQVEQLLDGPVVNLAEATTLTELAAAAEAADVFLSGDTGPMHLAAAVGTPVVALFTCTSPMRAGPRGTAHHVVTTTVPCAASYLRKCPDMKCMRELTPQRVWPAVSALLEMATQRLAGQRADCG
jgi:heptosyltransferase-1